MKTRWVVLLASLALITFTATVATATPTSLPTQTTAHWLRRCENNYDDEEIAAMQGDGEDGYEPDDCPLLAHVLTGPMAFNFCQLGDEDWVKFKAMPNAIYQIRAELPWNYPTEPHLDLYIDNVVVAQNDHYFNNNAEVWWWNTGDVRWVYVRATELRGRHDCGNNAYTLTLHAFPGGSLAPSPATPTLTPTLPLTDTTIISSTLTLTATITSTLPITPTLTPTVTPTPGS